MKNQSRDPRLTAGAARGEPVTLLVDGAPVPAFRGESVAAALFASGQRTLRLTARRQEPRGMFCAMGVCYDCLVSIAGGGLVRACMVSVEDGLIITTGVDTRHGS